MLVYLLIVVNFQSWLDPFIIVTALPAALAGIVVFLFLTGTTLSVPALMGAIMCDRRRHREQHPGGGLRQASSSPSTAMRPRAAVEAGFTRFRPVLMTALAMIIGMMPMALGLGEGGEQNAPLGRAVIGGLLCATVATLVFVPSVFALLHGRRARRRPGHDHRAHRGVKSPAAPTPASGRRRTIALVGALAVAALVLGLGIYSGVRARSKADATLRQATDEAAITTVQVVTPKPGDAVREIRLPGTTQAFIDAPIFARTSGYLKRWYFDIGARVKEGQLLAEIDSPEVDQQLQQARADLETAQANLRQAKITADRWQALLESGSVSRQETDVAVSALSAMKATVDSNTANVRRLEQLQGFEKIYAPVRRGDHRPQHRHRGPDRRRARRARASCSTWRRSTRLRVFVAGARGLLARRASPAASASLTLDEYPGREFHGTLVRNVERDRSRVAHAPRRGGRRQPEGRAAAGGVRVRAPAAAAGRPPRSPCPPTPCSSAPRGCRSGWCATARRCWCRSRSGTTTAPASRSWPGSIRATR